MTTKPYSSPSLTCSITLPPGLEAWLRASLQPGETIEGAICRKLQTMRAREVAQDER